MTFAEVAELAGFKPAADGKFNLPATQETSDKLAKTINDWMGEWKPGDDRMELTLTGAGPVWGYLAIAHAAHGRCARLIYAAPNATMIIWDHGCTE